MTLLLKDAFPVTRLAASFSTGGRWTLKVLPENLSLTWTLQRQPFPEQQITAWWWFQTWLLCSISYMGCHPSHWLSYLSRWLKPPTINVSWKLIFQALIWGRIADLVEGYQLYTHFSPGDDLPQEKSPGNTPRDDEGRWLSNNPQERAPNGGSKMI